MDQNRNAQTYKTQHAPWCLGMVVMDPRRDYNAHDTESIRVAVLAAAYANFSIERMVGGKIR